MTDNSTRDEQAAFVRVVSAVRWATLGTFVARAIAPLTMVLVAARLSPDEVGVVVWSLAIVAIAQVVTNSGFSAALVRSERWDPQVVNSIYWLQCGIGTLASLALLLGAPWLANATELPDLSTVLGIMCVLPLLGALSSVHNASLQRAYRFRELAAAQMVSTLTYGVLAVGLSRVGFGAAGLALAHVASSAVTTVVLRLRTDWSAEMRFTLSGLSEIVAIARWIFVEGILGFGFGWLDSLVIGARLRAGPAGVYRTGQSVVDLSLDTWLSPVTSVAYVTFSKLSEDRERLGKVFGLVNWVVRAAVIPVPTLAFAIVPILVPRLFSTVWSELSGVIMGLFVARMFAWTVGLNDTLYRAIGRSNVTAAIMSASLAVYVPVYFWAAGRSLMTFVYARVVLSALAMVLHAVVMRKLLRQHAPRLDRIDIPLVVGAAVQGGITFAMLGWVSVAGDEFHRLLIGGVAFLSYLVIVASSALAVFRQLRGLVGEKQQTPSP
jgi:teichuronic acid exporter